MDEYGVVMYGDFHAHSRKHNIFIYGCENRRNQDNHLREQIFPLLLHYNGGDKVGHKQSLCYLVWVICIITIIIIIPNISGMPFLILIHL